ncbi:hypothetical protein MN0502_01020 [Arthrobacter sp. MN05-02]|nr:hypothetical protein MN0502_01020 [Arthrobacter sp. MN05-02]
MSSRVARSTRASTVRWEPRSSGTVRAVKSVDPSGLSTGWASRRPPRTEGGEVLERPPAVVVESLQAEVPRLVRPEVGVPVAHRVAVVQDGSDSCLLAHLAALGVVLLVRGTGQRVRGDDHDVGRVGRGHACDTAVAGQEQGRLTAHGRKTPQRGTLLAVRVLRVGACRGEEQVAAGEEHGARLPCRALREAPRGLLARRVDLPQCGPIGGLLGVEGRDGRHEARARPVEDEAAEARQGDEVIER